MNELIKDKKKFETFYTDHYWNEISQREACGEEFIDIEDMYSYQAVSLICTVECPYCSAEQEVDLEDFESGTSSYTNEIGMGEDMVYYFDSEDNLECPACHRKYRVSGWISEYPIGAYDSEDVNVEELPEKE